jgi:hypothetical protein
MEINTRFTRIGLVEKFRVLRSEFPVLFAMTIEFGIEIAKV